jgi:hypothetical protein
MEGEDPVNRKANAGGPDGRHPALSEARPLFIDNQDYNTLAQALRSHLDGLLRQPVLPWGLSVASAFFDVPGFTLLADGLEQLGRVRLLLGADPPPEAGLRPPGPGEPPEPEFTRRRVADALGQLDQGLRRGADLLPFDEATDRAVRRLLDFLGSGKLEVRRYEEHFLPARVFLFNVPGGGFVAGSSNLTAAGLGQPPALNLGHYDGAVVDRVEAWYEDLWSRAAPFDLAAVYQRLTAEYPPYLIYLAVLYQLYGEELGEEQAETGGIPVTTFQKHGVWRALRILRNCGGVLIADGVGLGKTFLAGEIIRLYRERRQRVLLITPAALRDSTWKDFLNRFQLFVTCVSYEELARDSRLGGSGDYLHNDLDEFAVVVVDEAHNYRNPSAPARGGTLRQLMTGPRRDLVLLTATPVNNSLWDLYHLLRYFVKQDAFLADRGVLSLHERFKEAMEQDPFNLNPDLLYPVIDATTVKRTRHFVKKHYENDLITLPDGSRVPIRFPKPVASAISYDLETVLPGCLDELEQALMPATGPPRLTLARYQPENYPAGRPLLGTDHAIVGLLRSGLLKRFESSVYALGRTAAKMVREHELFLHGLENRIVIKKELLRELSAADDDDEMEEMLETDGRTEPASGYNVARLRADVRADLELLADLRRQAESVRPEDDPKLAALAEELARIARQAAKDGIDEEDHRRNRKVLIFSFYEDTVDWIEDYLRNRVEHDRPLAAYRGRIASVAGAESRHGVSRRDAVTGFAPESAGPSSTKPDPSAEKYDILICTDVLAEGMNLQECRNVINYDLPWNPMRLVQRHGRIDRIGSPHERVFLRTFFPDRQLNRLLDLEQRVRRKLAQAAASVGVEVAPIPHGSQREQSFAETREEIERLHGGDATLYERGGTAGAAQSGEEYRQDLRKGLLRWGDQVRNLPWKAGSGLAKGRRRGHFFCARVGEPGGSRSRVYLRFVPFGEPAEPIVREEGTCLRMIECQEGTPRVVPEDLQQGAFAAWELARHDVFEAWSRETDPANLQPPVPKLSREVARFLREHPPRGVEQARLQRCLDAVEAPCSQRDMNQLRAVFEAEYPGRDARARALVEEVERLGLEPFQAPDPLPPIRSEEIQLVCWLAIEKDN